MTKIQVGPASASSPSPSPSAPPPPPPLSPEETSALASVGDALSPRPPPPPPPAVAGRAYVRTRILSLLFLVLIASALIFRYEEVGEWLVGRGGDDVEIKTDGPNVGGFDGAAGGRTIRRIRSDLTDANVRLWDLLRSDYGPYADAVFNRTDVLRAFTRPSNASEYRLKRRMKRKVLEANLVGGGAASAAAAATTTAATTFTWVTGGHSAAAGHGDLLNQTYTASLQFGAEVPFDAVGVRFVAKHRAMGSTASGPEISLCMDALFGLDIDVLWWDYGMTDGRNSWLYRLWSERAGSHPTFPSLISYGGRQSSVHPQIEDRGLAAFALEGMQRLRRKFPDSKFHPNPGGLPRGVAYYMCGGKPENDDVCRDRKFNVTPCMNVRGQTNWHSGWKDHLLIGRVSAVFLTELLNDAVREMDERDDSDPPYPSLSDSYLRELVDEEESDRRIFMSSDIPTIAGGLSLAGTENLRSFYRGNPVCHSMRRPSQARCDGLVDGTRATAEVTPGYCSGIDDHYLPGTLPPPDAAAATMGGDSPPVGANIRPPWMVATDQGWRNDCSVPVNHDFRDSFVVRHEDGWMGDVYPNQATDAALSRVTGEREGIITICETLCEWGKCPAGTCPLKEVGRDDDGGGKLSIEIDGRRVVGARQIMSECYVMVGEGGSVRFGPGGGNEGNEDGDRRGGGGGGRYEIRFRVNRPGSMLRISSVIVL